MGLARIITSLGLAVFLTAGPGLPASAERRTVAPGEQNLQALLDQAADGDVIVLTAGVHRGPVWINHAITLAGEPGAVLAGSGEGSVVTVVAPGAAVRRLTIAGSGRSLASMDSGVFVKKGAAGAVVEGNRITENLFGIYLHGAERTIAQDNEIVGLRPAPGTETGNGISVWNATGAKIIHNKVRLGRDGIFVISSHKNVISRNSFRDLRFAIHYMYGDDGVITDNVSVGNTIGYALMFSQRLAVEGNVSRRDRDHGMLFNYANGSRISGNLVEGGLLPGSRWISAGATDREHAGFARETTAPVPGETQRFAPGKCAFIYNANNNRFRDNWFEGCEIGIHFTAGSERNEIIGNAFVNNRTQVKYVGTRTIDWSKDGRGNYWSDNPAFDLNGDGVADVAYRPNDLVDKALWLAPQAKVLVNSPAVQVIRWAQAQFPALLPGGVIDSHPLMAPPPRPVSKIEHDL